MQTQTGPKSAAHIRDLLTDLFEHQALLLAGWAESTGLSDRQRWNLVRLLDSSRRRLNRRLGDSLPVRARRLQRGPEHPAFRTFLSGLSAQNLPGSPRGDLVVRE